MLQKIYNYYLIYEIFGNILNNVTYVNFFTFALFCYKSKFFSD
jgi:hypothetical protein